MTYNTVCFDGVFRDMKTPFTAQTGIEIKRNADGRWRHVDTNDGRKAEVGPDYHTKAELIADHEGYLRRAGWLRN